MASTLLLLATHGLLAASPGASAADEPAVVAAEDDSGGMGELVSRTCLALDAIDVAATGGERDSTGPVAGPAVWGCYFAAFFSLSASPVGPGLMTACGTAGSAAVGAFLDGKSVLPVLLWTAPGVAVGFLLSLLGVAIAVGSVALYVAFTPLMTPPILGALAAATIVFSVASIISGPLTLMGAIHAEDELSGRRVTSSQTVARPPASHTLAQRF